MSPCKSPVWSVPKTPDERGKIQAMAVEAQIPFTARPHHSKCEMQDDLSRWRTDTADLFYSVTILQEGHHNLLPLGGSTAHSFQSPLWQGPLQHMGSALGWLLAPPPPGT